MWWHYFLVFVSTMLVDVVPLPLPPAFTVMVFLQIYFKLSIWPIIFIGVAGSITGRYILTLYIPKVAGHMFNPRKNEDVQFLGSKMKENPKRGQLTILIYSLMPLPTTPLFITAGMAKLKPIYIVPAFFVGKFTSDTIAVLMGEYAALNAKDLLQGAVSWKSITGLIVGLLLMFMLLFIDWRILIQHKKFRLRFDIWR